MNSVPPCEGGPSAPFPWKSRERSRREGAEAQGPLVVSGQKQELAPGLPGGLSNSRRTSGGGAEGPT
ncbi:hypothetical protein Y1Q_0006770 [Alligator mississippiensis]|uniref:Uncharacterized protein n=1 Tax=Alligator mississippiensis TaxID=8496 RepID=A0A151MRE0_ALLMI|nr:hypothetical protein Y1Q_0006770 [Alligator mississippiensis]